MTAAPHFYQAIGGLLATLVVAADGTKFLDTGEAQYSVFVPEQVQKKYQEKYQGEQVGWRVYPQFVDESLVFDVVSFATSPQTEPGQFILQGDWVSAGQLEIWRNAQFGRVNAENWQPRRLPISWSDAPLPDGSFWQLKAQLVDNTLKVVEAAGPFAHPPRLEKSPKFRTKQQFKQQQLGEPKQQHQTEQQATTNTETIDWEDITPVSGKLGAIR